MRILHISDTHGFHRELDLQEADIIIHSGDATNAIDPIINCNETWDFINWFTDLPYKRKIFVPGNHDTALYNGFFEDKIFLDRNIEVLINEETTIGDLKIWGSPYTPVLTNIRWPWGLRRSDMDKVWTMIPQDVNILITHGPPRGILDLCGDYNDRDAPCQAGDKIIMNKIQGLGSLKMHLFGHIHDEKTYVNSGVFVKNGMIFSNGSCAGRTKVALVNHGNILEV